MGKKACLSTLPLNQVTLRDTFWSHYLDLVRQTVIPYQWEALNDRIPDAEPSHAVKNFKIAAGLEAGEYGGLVFQDSDVAKWLEAVGYSLATHPDPALEQLADEVIAIIGKAQQPDGYLNTYFTLKEPGKRWTNLHECHELYCAGHMMEAAVAYLKGTGKRALLDIMCRFADYIDTVFGSEPGKIQGYDGHQEIELALVKLYEVTGNEKYLNLSRFFIDERGKTPNFFVEEWRGRRGLSHWTKKVEGEPNLAYNQSHKPVREQTEAVGHSVRAVYMYTAMADLAAQTGDEALYNACKRLWSNIITKQMYITGGIGSTHHGEAFTFDYDLPNDTVYAETCASIGLVFFAHRMLKMEANSVYADVIERILYNILPSAISRDGRSFFYVNPLEVWPEACSKNPGTHQVKPVRQKWFGCACCPPNIARLLASIGQYVYSFSDSTLYTHLYIGGKANIPYGEESFVIQQENRYPWEGRITLTFETAPSGPYKIALRIPGWCRKYGLYLNGKPVLPDSIEIGYACIERQWAAGDAITLELEMAATFMTSNPRVRANAGKLAIQRGPLVYCLEEADNGSNLSAISISPDSVLTPYFDENLAGGAIVLQGKAYRTDESRWANNLYGPVASSDNPVQIKAIPYYLWGNREPGEMLVWVRRA